MPNFLMKRPIALMLGLFFLPRMLAAETFTVTNSASTGPGSFSQAVSDANSTPNPFGPHQIVFAIPGPGVHKIDLSNGNFGLGLGLGLDLGLGVSTIIDGYTQPGASPNTLDVGDNAVILIQLDGGGPYIAPSYGLGLNRDHCVVRGLSFTGFTAAITIGGFNSGGHLIEGNFIGLSPDGVTLDGNDSGIVFATESRNDVIGGNGPAARNIISGNRVGISGVSHSIITGNYFGTDASGLRQGYGNDTAIGGGNDNIIGTGNPGEGNVITGNEIGINVVWGNTIRGNLIGPYADGSPSFGNGLGIQVAYQSAIGGLGPGEGNIIAFNDTGVLVAASDLPNTSTSVLSNLTYGNLGLDIDLGGDGLTTNDFRDQDSGPNNLQNFPIIISVTGNSGEILVSGGLNSTPSTLFTLQFFAQGTGGAGGSSERFLGTEMIATNSAGDASFQFTFPVTVSTLEFITATATDPAGNTSEFSPRFGLVELANVSTRGNVGPGDKALIGGFILDFAPPESSRSFLIRALGPSLNVSGALADPRIEVKASDGTVVATNDNWHDSQSSEIAATGLAPGNDHEAALILYPGTVPGNIPIATVIVSGADGGSGLATVEVYALGAHQDQFTQKLRNISTRGYVGTGDQALIAGTIIQGNAPERVIVRAIGPDLGGAGVANSLQDPILELRDAEGSLLATNDDWRSDQEQEIINSGVAPQDDRDSAILTSLFPTIYTAIVRGKNDTSGIALVEIYKLD